MGKRFDEWVAEFEAWGMTHDEAVAFGMDYWRSRLALAMDEFAAACAPLTRFIDRILRAISGSPAE